MIGRTLGERYVLEAALGRGGTGTVYRARHAKLQRPCAIKLLRRELVADPKVHARFTREAELAGTLSHRNLVGVLDVGEAEPGQLYMVMELAEGPDLGDVIGKEAPLPPGRIATIVRQLCAGLEHAHDRGLVHRDFKPENVIVLANDDVKIVDFGIAILNENPESGARVSRLTTEGMVVGTPSYMAPEQALARPVDHRVDLYALGVMIYEMLCAVRPFAGSGVDIAQAHVMAEPPPISARVPHLHADPLLEALAHKLMSKRADDRPQTARAVALLVDLIERDRPAAARALGVRADEAAPIDALATTRLPIDLVFAPAADGSFNPVLGAPNLPGMPVLPAIAAPLPPIVTPTISVEALAYGSGLSPVRPPSPRGLPWWAVSLITLALAALVVTLVRLVL
jgi:serine/threonine-protein kinase